MQLTNAVLSLQDGVAQQFVDDMKECVAEVMKTPKEKATGSAAMYGMAQAIPDRSLVEELVSYYLDLSYEVQPGTAD